MFEEEKGESNHLGSVLSPPTPSPPLLTSGQQKLNRYKKARIDTTATSVDRRIKALTAAMGVSS